MKRLLSLLLVIAMLFGVCAMFTACDGNSVSSEKEEEKKEEEKKSNKVKLNMKGVTVEEGVVYEDNGIILTAKSIELEDDYVEVYFDLENTSSEYRSVNCSGSVINGLSSSGYGFYRSLYGGESCEVSLGFYIPELEMLQVKTIGHIDFYLDISDENYNSLAMLEKVTVNTSEKDFVHTQTIDGEVLFEKSGIRITLIETTFSKNADSGMFVFVENKTDKFATVDLNNVVLNGWLQPFSYISTNLLPATNTVTFIDLSGLENMGIKKAKDIQNMSFDVSAYEQNYNSICQERQVSYIPGDKNFVKELNIEGKTVFDNDMVQILLVDAWVEDRYPVFQLYFKNKTDVDLSLSLCELIINGNPCTSTLPTNLPASAQSLQNFYIHGEGVYTVDSISELDSVTGYLFMFDYDGNDYLEKIEFPLD